MAFKPKFINRLNHSSFLLNWQYKKIYGNTIKALAVYLYCEGVMSNDRIAAFLNQASLNNLSVSEGSIYRFCKEFSKSATAALEGIKNQLFIESILHTDGTNISVNGKQQYIRNFSTEALVYYVGMEKKTIAAMKEIPLLASYNGLLIHDHETALYHFGSEHSECNVHLLRYLRKNSEETKNEWSDKLIQCLCEWNQEKKERLEQGDSVFSTERLESIIQAYDQIIKEGRAQNKKTRHKYAKEDEKSLLNRLAKYKDNHLMYLTNFNVAFDHNLSERDLRKVKNCQKMCGGFRKTSGRDMYCAILSIVETAKKRKQEIVTCLCLTISSKAAIL